MLILTRKEGESIRIGHDVVITVVEVRGNQVRIGVDAPRSVQVHRAEVYDQVVEENRTAVQLRPVGRDPANPGSAEESLTAPTTSGAPGLPDGRSRDRRPSRLAPRRPR